MALRADPDISSVPRDRYDESGRPQQVHPQRRVRAGRRDGSLRRSRPPWTHSERLVLVGWNLKLRSEDDFRPTPPRLVSSWLQTSCQLRQGLSRARTFHSPRFKSIPGYEPAHSRLQRCVS